MLRMIQVQGPIEALDAVQAVGREGLLDFQDYFRDQDSTYSALLVIFDDTEHGECDVLEQARTLLAEKGADADAFRATERFLHYPDAMESEWYHAIDVLGMRLLNLEALGVRTEEEQAEVEQLREEIRYRVAAACEVAEARIEEFTSEIDGLLCRSAIQDVQALLESEARKS